MIGQIKRIRHQKKRDIALTISATLFFISFIVASLFISYFFYIENFKEFNKTVSFINLYNFPVIVKVQDKEIKMDHFDATAIDLKVKNNLSIDVYNEAGELIDEDDINTIYNTSQISLFVLNNEVEFCFFSADVTAFYYPSENLPLELKDIKIFTNEDNILLSRTFRKNAIYIYPGRSDSSDAPQEITDGRVLRGIYPIECSNLNSYEKQLKTVLIFKDYVPAEHREFYNSAIERIKNLTL